MGNLISILSHSKLLVVWYGMCGILFLPPPPQVLVASEGGQKIWRLRGYLLTTHT